ncbi:MAG TPA: FAD-dependent oxidoreductase, partial [Burkholderiales bacterium]|nr:FAD-dependent oxidoreductase [Burkholderiales bacterium]
PDIYPVKGQMLLFESPGLLDTILFRDGIYLIPRKDGHILAGSTLENAGFDKTVTAERFLHEKASEMLPALRSFSPVKKWAGLRPGSPGNIPFICRHPKFDNLYINSGHFRYGVTMSPASAKLLASLIFEEIQVPFYSCQK